MKKDFFSLHLDFVGFWASTLCALHCMAVPLLVTFGAIGSLTWLSHPWLEIVFIGTSAVVATWSLIKSFLLQHRRMAAIKVVALGFVLLILSRFVAHQWEPWLAVFGGITVAGAHLLNWRLARSYHSCFIK